MEMLRRVPFARHATTGLPLSASLQIRRCAGEHHAARFKSMNQQVNSTTFSEKRNPQGYDDFMRATPPVHTSQRLDEMYYKPQAYRGEERQYKTWIDFPMAPDNPQQSQPHQQKQHPHMMAANHLRNLNSVHGVNKKANSPKENKRYGALAEAQDQEELNEPNFPIAAKRLDDVHYKSKIPDKKPTLVEYVIGLRGNGGLAKDRVRKQNYQDNIWYTNPNTNPVTYDGMQQINQSKANDVSEIPKLDARRLVQRRLASTPLKR